MNPTKVRFMRSLYRRKKLTQEELATLFDCSQQTVSNIVNYRSWTEAGDEEDPKGSDDHSDNRSERYPSLSTRDSVYG